MIETTYQPLHKAAETLKTDSDSLLIAGIEGRIQLFGLLGEHVTLTSGIKLIDPNNPESADAYSEELKQEWIDFFPIDRTTCARILKAGISGPIYWISEEHDDQQWQIFESGEAENPDIVIKKSSVFIPQKTVDQINAKGIPAKDSVPETKPKKTNTGHETRKNNSHLRIITALMDKLGLTAEEHGVQTKISKWTELNGKAVGPDTVGKILKEAMAIAKNDAAI